MILAIPFALLSFGLFALTRSCVGKLLAGHMKKHPEDATTWRILSGKTIRTPLALPVIMTSAPRWNPHALIGTLGPLSVEREMRICVESAARSAQTWTIVVYAMPGRRTVASIGSLDGPAPDGWRTVPLARGQYGLAARYYGWKQDVEFPAIKVDSVEIVKAQRQAGGANEFYEDLKGRSGFFYQSLHYHVLAILRYRKHLSAQFVERHYLPVGNPETEFFYGILKNGERLQLDSEATVLKSFNIYLTIYNSASFPIRWYSVTEGAHTTIPAKETSSYLVRIHKFAADNTLFDRRWVRTAVIPV